MMATKPTEKYIETVGRRKTAIARVRITPSAKGSIEVNGKPFDTYFPTKELQATAQGSLEGAKLTTTKFVITALLNGGGAAAQAVARSRTKLQMADKG